MSKDKKDRTSRRKFLKNLTLATAAGVTLPVREAPARAKSATLPRRTLGGTGAQVSVLAFGSGSRFLMYEEEDQALEALTLALDGGINYIDTAVSYGNGKSESRIGQLMPTRRKEIFLATKIQDRTRDGFRRDLEASLKRLRVDQLDLLHIHSLGREDDLRKVEAPDGVLQELYRAREQKLTRFIGITSHTDGPTLARALERHDFDCTQMALNPSLFNGFEEHALPVARKKNLGIIAMKVTAQGKLLGEGPGLTDVESLFRYDLSLPVATVSFGMPKIEFIRHNLKVARNFNPLTEAEAQGLQVKLAPSRRAMEEYWAHHVDGVAPLHA